MNELLLDFVDYYPQIVTIAQDKWSGVSPGDTVFDGIQISTITDDMETYLGGSLPNYYSMQAWFAKGDDQTFESSTELTMFQVSERNGPTMIRNDSYGTLENQTLNFRTESVTFCLTSTPKIEHVND